MLSQQAYAEELLRVNDVKPTALGKVPCPRDLVSFDTLLTDESPTEESVRIAQRLTGEILWLSQRTRPDLAFTACVLASLSTDKGAATGHSHRRKGACVCAAYQGASSHR